MKSSTALITGASGGIGLELATVCAQHGHDLILVARSKERLQVVARNLEEVYNVAVTTIVQDLARSDAVTQLQHQLKDRHIDILINNAGFGLGGEFIEQDIDRLRDMIAVNITALTELTRIFASQMTQQNRGRIMNVGSVAGFLPGPYMAVYHATKAYVLSFSEALAYELKDSNVSITALCPGPTKTNFAQAAGVSAAQLFEDSRLMDARTVARQGYKGMMTGKSVVITGVGNKLVAWAPRFLPRNLSNRSAAKAQEISHD